MCGKLLTLHRRGNGVDVEALHDRTPLRQDAVKGPKMGSHGYRRLWRWKSIFVNVSGRLGILGIYIGRIRVRGPPRGPQDRGRAL